MSRKHFLQLCVLVAMPLILAPASAQQTVYKWVDENGVVHFGESAPAGVDAEVVTTSAAPTVAPASTKAEVPAQTTADKKSAAPANASADANAAVAKPVAIADMSLDELDARCEAAREELLKPLREETIAKCKSGGRSDPVACERMHADFGVAVRNANGTLTPRMFDDIPPCEDARNERNRRPR